MKIKIQFVFIALAFNIVSFAAPVDEGKTIFTSRCGNCHKIDKVSVGPALSGLDQRREMDWIIKFVKSSQSMVQSGDKTAKELFEKFNKIPMPDHSDLSDENIKNVVEYIKDESSKVTKISAVNLAPRSSAFTMLSITSYKFFISYFVVVAMLIMALLFAVQVKEYERKKTQNI